MDSDNTMPRKPFLIYALILMITGISLGAIGAHALEGVEALKPENIESWKTGVLYQLLMATGIMLIIMLERVLKLNNIKSVLIILAIGVSLFSFSIYILVFNHIWNISIIKYSMIPLTPIGGVLMILAWTLFLYKIVRYRSDESLLNR